MYKMKSFKRVLVLVMLIMLVATCGFVTYAQVADVYTEEQYEEVYGKKLPIVPSDFFELSAREVTVMYSANSTGANGRVPLHHMWNQNEGDLIAIHKYVNGVLDEDDGLYSEPGMADQSSEMLGLFPRKEEYEDSVKEFKEKWEKSVQSLVLSLVDGINSDGKSNIKEDDVTIVANVFMPKVEGYVDEGLEYELSNKEDFSESDFEKAGKMTELDRTVAEKLGHETLIIETHHLGRMTAYVRK